MAIQPVAFVCPQYPRHLRNCVVAKARPWVHRKPGKSIDKRPVSVVPCAGIRYKASHPHQGARCHPGIVIAGPKNVVWSLNGLFGQDNVLPLFRSVVRFTGFATRFLMRENGLPSVTGPVAKFSPTKKALICRLPLGLLQTTASSMSSRPGCTPDND